MVVELVVPSMGESVITAIVARWLRTPGEMLLVDQPVVELDSDKASMEVPAPASGRLLELLVAAGDEVKVGQVLARIDSNAVGSEASASPASAPSSTSAAAPAASMPEPASPSVRQAIRESGVDPASVGARGRGGGLTRADVSAAGKPAVAQVAAPVPALIPTAAAVSVGAPSVDEPVEIVPMTSMRRRIAERLVEAQHTAAILTTFNEVDMSAVMALREKYQDRFSKRYGIKLGFMSFFVKAAIEALKAFPSANAEIRGTDIVYKRFFHVGVAVSGPRGLVVPVVRHADRLSFAETELAIAAFGQKAKESTLTADHLRGGTFTVSNGGIFGSMMSTPILNAPQVAILGMHAITKRAVVVTDAQGHDTIVVRPMMYLAVSYDHRLLDGREAVSFLVRIKECIENPERMLLEV